MIDTEHLLLLTELISRISAPDSADTIAALSRELNLPEAQIRNAVNALSLHSLTAQLVNPADPETAGKWIHGRMDQEKLSSGRSLYPEDFTALSLQPEDYRLLSARYPSCLHTAPRFAVKATAALPQETILKYRNELAEHIESPGQWKASFLYGTAGTEQKIIECIPCAILPDSGNSTLYLLSRDQQQYALTKIRGKITFTRTSTDSVNEEIRQELWSCEDLSAEPVYVKIRISHVTKSMMEKIRKDLQKRTATAKLYPKGDFYYYEDQVAGLQAFERWIRSYGSAMTVVRPKFLLDRLCTDAAQKKERYALLQKALLQ